MTPLDAPAPGTSRGIASLCIGGGEGIAPHRGSAKAHDRDRESEYGEAASVQRIRRHRRTGQMGSGIAQVAAQRGSPWSCATSALGGAEGQGRSWAGVAPVW